MDVLWPLWVKLQLGEMWQFDVMECFPQKIRNMDPWNWFLNINILWEIWYDFLHFLYRTTKNMEKTRPQWIYDTSWYIECCMDLEEKHFWQENAVIVLKLCSVTVWGGTQFSIPALHGGPCGKLGRLGFREIWHPTALKRKFHLNKIVFKQKEKLGSRIIFQLATYSFFLGFWLSFFKEFRDPSLPVEQFGRFHHVKPSWVNLSQLLHWASQFYLHNCKNLFGKNDHWSQRSKGKQTRNL